VDEGLDHAQHPVALLDHGDVPRGARVPVEHPTLLHHHGSRIARIHRQAQARYRLVHEAIAGRPPIHGAPVHGAHPAATVYAPQRLELDTLDGVYLARDRLGRRTIRARIQGTQVGQALVQGHLVAGAGLVIHGRETREPGQGAERLTLSLALIGLRHALGIIGERDSPVPRGPAVQILRRGRNGHEAQRSGQEDGKSDQHTVHQHEHASST
jgi:hypothetical protein